MKKSKLSETLTNLFNFQNFAINGKRMFFDNESTLKKTKKISCRRDLGFLNTPSGQKDFLNYITSRNMRKTMLPSNFKNVLSHPEMNIVNLKYILHVILHKLKKSKELLYLTPSVSTLSFHTKSTQLKSLLSDVSKGDEKMPEAASNLARSSTVEEEPEKWGGEEPFKLIKFIKNFDEVLKAHPRVLILFYAYWCNHCSRLKLSYGKAALKAKEAKLDIVFGAFDVTTNPDLADEMGVIGVPTVKYYKNGKFITMYKGQRTTDDLFAFVKDPPSVVDGPSEM